MAFLRPCSIVIEITPFGYRGQFDPLMVETGLVYSELVAEKQHSLLLPGAASSNGIACQPLYGPLPAGDPAAAQDWCMTHKYCR